MTVRDLIKQLKSFDGDMEIYKEFEAGGQWCGCVPTVRVVEITPARMELVDEFGKDAGSKLDKDGYPHLNYLDDKRIDLKKVKGQIGLAI